MHQAITIATVVHIPMLAGYWADSLNVLKLFFDSLYSSTQQPFDLMVFDNASCPDVQDYLIELQRTGRIQFLTLSAQNLKKLGAMDFLFANAPGEFVAFVDSDVYHFPGWLEESQAILEAFPEAGQVSALPTIDKRAQHVQSTLRGLESAPGLMVERGRLIPEAYIDAHRQSIGREKEDYLRNAGTGDDVRITRGGIRAYVSAQDFQFITRREVIDQALPLKVRSAEEYYDPIYSPVFEAKVDENGWWRLSTNHYLVHHMGNQLPDLQNELAGVAEIQAIPLPVNVDVKNSHTTGWQTRILQSHFVRSWLKRIYTWAYSMLFERA